MKNYIALKSCRFQGKNYKVGEKISEEVIEKKSVGALLEMEYIAPISPPEKIFEKFSEKVEEKKPKKKLKVGDENDVQLQS